MRLHWTRAARGAGLLMAALLASPPASAPALAAPPDVISGPSPFAACKVKGEDGTNFLNAEVEPWVDVNPSDPQRVVAGWQQDRWSNGGARSLLSAYSRDGGKNWKRVVVPGINKCSGGKGDFAFDRSGDPWLAVSPNGTSYFLTLSANNPNPEGGFGINAVLVSRSTTGGMSWGAPTVLRRDTDPRVSNDKISITADPRDGRYVYAVWDQYGEFLANNDDVTIDPPPSASPQAASDGALLGRRHFQPVTTASATPSSTEDYFQGPTFFARTADGGLTWEPARMIYDAGRNAQSFGNQIVVLRDGTVLVFYMEIFATGETRIRVLRSTDHGNSFSPPAEAAAADLTDAGTLTPDLRAPVRDASFLFDVATDRVTGRLYLVWQDHRQGGVDRIAFAMSADGGASWTTPAIISKTPANANSLRTQAFVPSVEVGADTLVYVTYYDFRNDPARSLKSEMADYWAVKCQPAFADCSSPASWGKEMRLTARAFDMLNAPKSGDAYFLGDYQGLVKQGSSVRAVFTVATTPRQTSTVTSLIH